MSGEQRTGPFPILAVLGGSAASIGHLDLAERVGGIAAEHRWVVLTGGGPGVMAAASRGAVESGGLTIGILPVSRSTNAYPNPWVRIPIFTGAGSARNAFNVLSANLCVALGGGAGTLSEIALALKSGTPVWAFESWALNPPKDSAVAGLRVFSTADELLQGLALKLAGGG